MATSGLQSKNTAQAAMRPSEASQASLVKYAQNTCNFLNGNFNMREQFLKRDQAYYREKDFSDETNRAKWANDAGNPKALQNITIPVVYPQVETATSFLTDIFLTGYPIFPILAKPAMADAALQMETTLGEQSVRYGWAAQLMMAFRNGLKYNLMAVEVSWDTSKVWAIETDTTSTSAAAKTTETYYQGNNIKNLDPYNLIIDTRVPPAEVHKRGEFAGYTELMSRTELKQYIASIEPTRTMNATKAFESGTAIYTGTNGSNSYYIPQVNPTALLTPKLTTTDWGVWGGLDKKKDGIQYNNMYEVTRLYCRIIPSDHDLNTAAPNTVQIYKLVIVNRKVLILCERQTNAHNYLPIIVGQPMEDGLGYQTKSFADNATPLQDAATSLFRSALESQRRKVYDRMIFDPSKVDEKSIRNVDAVARIAIKQSAYGTPLNEAVYQIPYRDDGVAEILAFSQKITELADQVNGQNRASQGQFQKGNKSRREFDTVMGNSNGRSMMMALGMEYRFFQPIKEIIKLNTLQFQPPATLFNRNTKAEVKVDPTTIRTASLEFRLADGLLPIDKMITMDSIGTVMQMGANNPQLQAEYDLTGAMMYAIKEQGASWIDDFKRSPQDQQTFLNNAQATAGVTDATGNPIAPQPQSVQ